MENNTALYNQLLDSGVHFGHLRKKWNPKMLPYIFSEKKGVHIIDLNKTIEHLNECVAALKSIAKSGKKILFVATKTQAKQVVTECAIKIKMPYVTERWLGGTLTNFSTIKKSIKKMNQIDKMLNDGSLDNITKKERLQMSRSKDKMERILGGIAGITRSPQAVFLVDIGHEKIALNEAKKLNISTFGLVDTNNNPELVDFFIPCNDDSTKSIAFIMHYITDAILESLQEREKMKEEESQQENDSNDNEEIEKNLNRLDVLATKTDETEKSKKPTVRRVVTKPTEKAGAEKKKN